MSLVLPSTKKILSNGVFHQPVGFSAG
ncbi:hypothetical protein YPPY54_0682, partial [Yersinia pestis PY-54]